MIAKEHAPLIPTLLCVVAALTIHALACALINFNLILREGMGGINKE